MQAIGYVHLPRQQVLGVEPWIDVEETDETSKEQSRAGGERDRQSDLGDDQRGADPPPPSAADRAAAMILQRRLRIDARRGQRRREADEDACDHRDQCRDDQDAPVHGHFVDARQVRGRRCHQSSNHRPQHAEADQATCGREHDALGQELANKAGPAGAERGPGRELALASDRSGQQQVGDVHRGHQQHASNAGHQDEQGRADRSDRLIERRHHRHAPSLVGVGKALLELRRNRLELGLGPRRSHARLEAADRAPPVHVAHQRPRLGEHPVGASDRTRKRDRHPHVHASDAREAAGTEHPAVGEHEVGRHHADDLEREVRQLERPADDGRVTAEAALPVPVAEDHFRYCVLGSKCAAESRRAAEQIE